MKILAVLFALLVLTGCSQSASFVAYERVEVGRYESPSLVIPRYRQTGKATVKLADGTLVEADCPIVGLEAGDSVSVKQLGDGAWVVTR